MATTGLPLTDRLYNKQLYGLSDNFHIDVLIPMLVLIAHKGVSVLYGRLETREDTLSHDNPTETCRQELPPVL